MPGMKKASAPFICFISALPTPSYSFKVTFADKCLAYDRHLRPREGISLASMLPIKLISLALFQRADMSPLQAHFPFLPQRRCLQWPPWGLRDTDHMLHIDGTHLCKLNQMIRTGIHIGSAVNQKGYSFFCRNQRRKRRTLHTFDSYRRSTGLPPALHPCCRQKTNASACPCLSLCSVPPRWKNPFFLRIARNRRLSGFNHLRCMPGSEPALCHKYTWKVPVLCQFFFQPE